MDVVKIVGCTMYSFVDKNGSQVEGYKYHCTAPAPLNDPNFKGQQVLSFSVSLAKRNQWLNMGFFIPDVGDDAMIYYNRYGKVDQFGPVPVKGSMPPLANEHQSKK